MKKLSIICLVAVLASCSPAAQKQEKTNVMANPDKTDKTIVYTCSMHPEVAETKPGTCPKCGMDLVEKQN